MSLHLDLLRHSLAINGEGFVVSCSRVFASRLYDQEAYAGSQSTTAEVEGE